MKNSFFQVCHFCFSFVPKIALFIISDWSDSFMNYYSANTFAVDTFDVEIENTASAERCKLNNNNKYRLALSTQHITLLDTATEIPLLSWLYK